MVCTFFGHRFTPIEVREPLSNILTDLIENRDVNVFYVGNHGDFDRIVLSVLRELKKKYMHIKYYVVLAYMPKKTRVSDNADFSETIYPDGLETVPCRLAILKRNEWMSKKSDIVVAYVIGSAGGASTALEYARKKKKEIINIAI